MRRLLVRHPVLVAFERDRNPRPPRWTTDVRHGRRANVPDVVDVLTAGPRQAGDVLAERARNVDGRELGVGNRFGSDSRWRRCGWGVGQEHVVFTGLAQVQVAEKVALGGRRLDERHRGRGQYRLPGTNPFMCLEHKK